MNGWMLEELLVLERVANRPSERLRPEVLAYLAERRRPAWPRRALGSALVRLGRLIDGTAREGLVPSGGQATITDCRAT